jgi:hypothetical protein
MGRGKKVQDTKEALFKRLYGVKPDTFNIMVLMIQKEFNPLYTSGGKPPKLKPEDKRYSTLKYLRQYRTMDRIAAEYNVCKGTVCLSIQWVEDVPTQNRLIRQLRYVQCILLQIKFILYFFHCYLSFF